MKNEYDKILFRILSIAQYFMEGKTLKKSDLAKEFNVSEKTIQRDINNRLSSMPIKFYRGVGWKLDEKFINKKLSNIYELVIEENRLMEYLAISIANAKNVLDEASAILITAGAGMGVDSGLPDFRGDHGFWKAYPPLEKLGLNFYDMANPRWFLENAKMAWGFYGHRLNLYRTTIPHQGFQILKELINYKNNNYFIFTSNVDGQFQKAGFEENKIMECHGSIHYNQCVYKCTENVWSNEHEHIDIDLNTFLAKSRLPQCKHCGNLARPNVLMFGDFQFTNVRVNHQQLNFLSWIKQNVMKNKKIAIIEIGAGKKIPTVRNLSEDIMRQYNAKLIRINPRDYDGPKNVISIPLGGLEALSKIFQ